MEEMYVPVCVESIDPNIFPDVALYLKSGAHYVLYKSQGRNFDKLEASRFEEKHIEYLYVSQADMAVITEFMEKNASRLLEDDSITNRAKGKIIYQTSINFVGDIFGNPEKVGDFNRCKLLIENLLIYLSKDKEALSSLESVMSYNYFTFVHSLQVTALSLLLNSEVYLLTRDELIDVGIGSILHDFGKIFVPQEILNKNGKLSESEMAQLRKHPEDGYRFLKENTRLSEVSLSIVRHHHERNNGNGYPLGLKGDAIPRSAQAAGICDVYCVLTIDRTGRKSLPPHIAIQFMRQEMKGAFNDTMLEKLETLVSEEGYSSMLL